MCPFPIRTGNGSPFVTIETPYALARLLRAANPVAGSPAWAGLPAKECGFLADLVDKGEVGLELCHDPCVDMIVGVYAIRPVGR